MIDADVSEFLFHIDPESETTIPKTEREAIEIRHRITEEFPREFTENDLYVIINQMINDGSMSEYIREDWTEKVLAHG